MVVTREITGVCVFGVEFEGSISGPLKLNKTGNQFLRLYVLKEINTK